MPPVFPSLFPLMTTSPTRFLFALRAVSATALLVGIGCLSSCDSYDDTRRTVDFEIPPHFMSAEVASTYPTPKAIAKPGYFDTLEGASLSIQTHPEMPAAQLRVVQLPKTMHASHPNGRKEALAALHLAESGVIQDCDILTVYRPEWSLINGYGNVQLGQGHSALAFVEEGSDGKRYVHTVENPLSYSSRLNHGEHYGGHDIMNVIRPNLSKGQKANLKAWGQKTREATAAKVRFYKNYGKPYQVRGDELPSSATGNLPVDLAKAILYPDEDYHVGTYCSELIWGLLALRDIDPEEVVSRFPAVDADGLNDWLRRKAKPFVDPLPGATAHPTSSPGLMQGPDLQLRRILAGDNQRRRDYLLENVLLLEEPNPAGTAGLMSSGHRESARLYLPKIKQLRAYYGPKDEAASYIPDLNQGVPPNYSPTSFFILANKPGGWFSRKKFHYVATVSFRPRNEAVAGQP